MQTGCSHRATIAALVTSDRRPSGGACDVDALSARHAFSPDAALIMLFSNAAVTRTRLYVALALCAGGGACAPAPAPSDTAASATTVTIDSAAGASVGAGQTAVAAAGPGSPSPAAAPSAPESFDGFQWGTPATVVRSQRSILRDDPGPGGSRLLFARTEPMLAMDTKAMYAITPDGRLNAGTYAIEYGMDCERILSTLTGLVTSKYPALRRNPGPAAACGSAARSTYVEKASGATVTIEADAGLEAVLIGYTAPTAYLERAAEAYLSPPPGAQAAKARL